MASSSYPTLSLSGMTVLVTGASSGIGEAIARRFAEAGSRLIITARRTERIEALKKELEDTYKVSVFALTLDMQDVESVKKVQESLPADFAEVDILVNNAGLALGAKPVHENEISDIITMVNTNCTGLAIITRVLTPGMVARNRGHLVNISSIAAHYGYPGGSIYTGTKHFVDAFNECARMDLAGTNIRVTAISPGAVETEFSVIRFGGDAEKAKSVYAGIVPLSAADIADNVLYAVTRPQHVQIGEIIVWASYQAAPSVMARPLLDKE